MKLDFEDIKKITLGAVDVTEEDGKIVFHRFNSSQEQLYKETLAFFYFMNFAPAGVRLSFKTDSKKLFLKCSVHDIIPVHFFFSMDVLQDGEYLNSLTNFCEEELDVNYAETKLPLGEFSKEFVLKDGEKKVDIFLPYSVRFELLEMSLDDGASLVPVNISKKFISLGDSITHGFHSLRSYKRYPALLAQELGMEEICKAIAGEKFFPELADIKDDFVPEFITVAYGTNDWNSPDLKENLINNCRNFYTTLCKAYPNVKIFAITPIWRGDWEVEKPMGKLLVAKDAIEIATKDLENVILIDGLDLVPHEEKYFGDRDIVHLTAEGNEHYSKNLLKKIKAYF